MANMFWEGSYITGDHLGRSMYSFNLFSVGILGYWAMLANEYGPWNNILGLGQKLISVQRLCYEVL